MHQTIKGFYVYLLSSFYIGVQSFGKSTGPFSVYIPQGGVIGCSSSVDFSFYSVNFRLVSVKKLLKPPACFGAFRHIFWFCAKILYSIETLIDAQTAGSRPPVSMSISHHCVFLRHNYSNLQKNNLHHLKESFRSISVFSSVMCHRHTPSSKIDLSSKIFS